MADPFATTFRLATPRGGARLACDEKGVTLGPVTLVDALSSNGRCVYRVRPAEEVARAQALAYGPFGHEDNKFIGAYSTRENAQSAIDQLKDQPGFRDDPTQFGIYECTLDRTSWREGFIRVADAMQPKD